MPTLRHHCGIHIHPALHLASQQGIHLLTEAPRMGKCCNTVLALLPDWHSARSLEGKWLLTEIAEGTMLKKRLAARVCAYALESFHLL